MKTRSCNSCGHPCDQGSRTGLCRSCWTPEKHPDRFCGCGTKLGRHNKSGLCKPCVCRRNHADPEFHARLLVSVRKSNADPALRQKRAIACRAACRTPAERQRRSELGKRTHPNTIHSEKAKARAFSPEAVRLRSIARVATMAEKRRQHEAGQAAKVERENLAELTPFERAMERVRQGASITAIQPMPRREYAYTLGGVSG